MEKYLDTHSNELLILSLFAILVIALIIIVPQLLRAHLQTVQMNHEEVMRALENGDHIPPGDEGSRAAGRTALLVPMVVMISAGVVTCFLVAYKSDYLFAVSLSVWVVGGVVSLAAITGGVALLGRIAQFQSGHPGDDTPDEQREADDQRTV